MSKINHVAIIMDGNGRWANERRHTRVWGHIRGARVVNEIVRSASEINLKALTLYAFSTENWNRPKEEVQTLFRLLKKFLIREGENIVANNVQFKMIGDISHLNEETKNLIKKIESESSDCDGLKLNFAFSYGGRREIVDAVNSFVAQNPGKPLTEDIISSRMYRPDAGDVDLMIRSGGDQRISNFMLWESNYAELFFTATKWPDFTSKEFVQIIDEVAKRERRFGALSKSANIKQEGNNAEKEKMEAISHGN
ncbi:MAG: polyprenyl diphosphate synthase [Bacteriovoracaceae bacterium]